MKKNKKYEICEECGGDGFTVEASDLTSGLDEHGNPIPLDTPEHLPCNNCEGTGYCL